MHYHEDDEEEMEEEEETDDVGVEEQDFVNTAEPQKMDESEEQKQERKMRKLQLLGSGSFGPPPPSSPSQTNLASLVLQRSLRGPFSSRDRLCISPAFLPNSPPRLMLTHPACLYTGQFSEDGSLFYLAGQDWRVKVLDCSGDNWEVLANVRAVHGQWTLTDTVVSRDKRLLAYSSITPYIHLCPLSLTQPNPKAQPKQERLDLSMGKRPFGVWALRLSADNQEIIAGASDSTVYVYNVERKEVVTRVRAHEDHVNTVAFADACSPHVLFSGSDDCCIFVWDRRVSMANHHPAGILVGHTEGLTFICPKGDGRYLLSNSKDQTMKLWDIRRMRDYSQCAEMRKTIPTSYHWDYRYMDYPGNPHTTRHPFDDSIVTFTGHKVLRTLIRCYFSPVHSTGQRYVYTGSQNGRVYVYDLDGSVVQTLHLSPSEVIRDTSWHPYLPLLSATSWGGRVSAFTHQQP